MFMKASAEKLKRVFSWVTTIFFLLDNDRFDNDGKSHDNYVNDKGFIYVV